ncbi:MAG: hypothetical protein ACXAB4_02365 [Candidatus Hodarchaeales archaeon]|jgi:hypothetical protein
MANHISNNDIDNIASMLTDDPDIFVEAEKKKKASKKKSKKKGISTDTVKVDDKFETHSDHKKKKFGEPGDVTPKGDHKLIPDSEGETGSGKKPPHSK